MDEMQERASTSGINQLRIQSFRQETRRPERTWGIWFTILYNINMDHIGLKRKYIHKIKLTQYTGRWRESVD
jgi:hypothetical protein